jgi:hypothetical protein
MIKNFKGKRNLKKNFIELKPEQFDLNPITLEYILNESHKKVYFTKYTFDKDKNLKITSLNKDEAINNDNIMLVPSLLISTNNFLKIYDIENITELVNYIDKNLNLKSFNSLNRIINCWIRDNFDSLKKNNKILSSIYFKLFTKFLNYDIEEKNFIKDSLSYINKWFKINNSKNFNLNLANDLEKFLSKKYES